MSKKRRLFGQRPAPRGKGNGSWLVQAFILAVIWGGILVGSFVIYCALDLPDIHQITQPTRRPSVTLEAEDGTVFARYGDLYGDHVTLEEVPQYLPEAIISIEDRRFYSHFGIDIWGLLRAALRDVTAGHVVQGGSTLTQQLAKNLFLSPDRNMKRKVQEMMLALWLEHTYTKDQILTAYLNRVYLGNGSYGVDAASRIYFGKSAREINLREAAIIAGLLRAPSRFAPTHDPALSMARGRVVLEAMVEAGYITPQQKQAAITSAPPPMHKPGPAGDGRYFADWVQDQIGPLVEDASQDIIVSTTLDLNLERSAERNLDAVLAKQDLHDVSQGALVTLANDGAVRAMVGGRNYSLSQFNRATQAMRQPGSSFKPIVYLTAIQQGLTPEDIIPDAPITLGHWSPENFDGKYRGPITAREALAESINTVAVRVFMRAGADNVIATARALGITSPLEHDPALALGASEVTPLEITGAYASLAADGRAITPYAIKEIRNRDGQVLYHHTDVTPPVTVNEHAVEVLVDMMQDVVKYGTGKRAQIGRPVAGKTGTSSDYRDAWFLGFTGNYTTGVWVGNDDNAPMKKITGGSLPAEIWHNYMADAESSIPERDLLSGGPTSVGAVTQEISKAFGDFIQGIIGNGSNGESR
ncbi:MAG TPA: PBP1A family penicillin-binding protein [Alphaproteobacteria bacterium]|nr:PBP1A family penicillin-binding protein [Alphaproteobacteria bacterium]